MDRQSARVDAECDAPVQRLAERTHIAAPSLGAQQVADKVANSPAASQRASALASRQQPSTPGRRQVLRSPAQGAAQGRRARPIGREQQFEIERNRLLVISDLVSRDVLGYHLNSNREYTCHDLIRTIEAALEPTPRADPAAYRTRRREGGAPSVARRIGRPVILVDERLTSASASASSQSCSVSLSLPLPPRA